MKGIVIAGTHSGSGKTSVSLGLMAALAGQGIAVQPFKAGPDFIDPGLHGLAAGRASHNLDGWMCSEGTVRDIHRRFAADADISILEGVMGLFDGASGTSEAGSTAQLAKWLRLPVVLVIDARSMARSAAAVLGGYRDFDPELSLAGVIFNKVGSMNHETLLREAAAAHCPDIAVLGCLRRSDDLAMPSRHLGLVTAEEAKDAETLLKGLGTWISEGLDMEGLHRLMEASPAAAPVPARHRPRAEGPACIGVARDRAFCFYYEENLRLLKRAGATLNFFSPLEDKKLPEGLDGLYFGGGYPELNAMELANNSSMRKSIARFLDEGKPAYAECGGFMYLMKSLKDERGRSFPMVGKFPFSARMNERRAALGYREITTTRDTLFGSAGMTARGHEFHYSNIEEEDTGFTSAYASENRAGKTASGAGYAEGNVLGSYVHLHFGSNPDFASGFVAACARAASAETD